MTPSITRAARATWAALNERDFDAVTDLMDALIEASDTGHWDEVDTLAEIDAGYYQATVIRADLVLVLLDLGQLEIFALGRPT